MIESGNTDFARFGSTSLNIFMFAVLLMLFGLLVAPLVEWANVRFQSAPTIDPPERDSLIVLISLFLIASIPLVLISLLVFTGVVSDPVKVIIPALLLALIPLAHSAQRSRQASEANRSSRNFLAGYGLIAVASLIGLVFGLQSIVEIRECAEILSASGFESVGITDETAKHLCEN